MIQWRRRFKNGTLYDDLHPTEIGAAEVAKLVAELNREHTSLGQLALNAG